MSALISFRSRLIGCALTLCWGFAAYAQSQFVEGQPTDTSLPFELQKQWAKARLEFRIDDNKPLKLQQATAFTLEACTPSNVIWQKPLVPTSTGIRWDWLRESQVDINTPDGRCTATRWHGTLTPSLPGQLKFPGFLIKGVHFGTELSWPVSSLELLVEDEWLWIPSGISTESPTWKWIQAPKEITEGSMVFWRAELLGQYATETLRQLLQSQLLASGWSEEPVTLTHETLPDGKNRWIVDVFAIANTTSAAPTLRLPWFNSNKKILQHVAIAWPPYQVLPKLVGAPETATPLAQIVTHFVRQHSQQLTWAVLSTGILLGSLYAFRRRLNNMIWRLRWRTCATPLQLQRQLFAYTQSLGHKSCNLTHWCELMSQDYLSPDQTRLLQDWTTKFEAYRFRKPIAQGNHTLEWKQIKAQWLLIQKHITDS